MNENERKVKSFEITLNEKGKPLFQVNKIRTNKYHLLTFVPVNLFHQFSRLANFYFLIVISLLQFDWAPISASAALVPLIIVILISMIREGIEDILRWRSDQKINALPAKRLENGNWADCRWDEIRVSDVIHVEKNEQIPADIVLISTSDKEGNAYIDTCNLDGETNLKARQALKQTRDIIETADLQRDIIDVSCDLPNNKLYQFNGNLTVHGEQCSLDNNAVLLRGTKLKNTSWVNGLVIYTGHDTKIMMNQCDSRTKRSLLERGLNMKLISVFILIFALAIIASSIGFVYEKTQINTSKVWYFYRNKDNRRNPVGSFFILFVSHLIVINAMIPISLYVTLEVVRVFQAMFILWDQDMYDEETQTGCVPRTTNISDDLGQISYIFSDKTGTLTRNVMDFMKCSVGGKVYGSGTTEVAYAAAKRRGENIPPPSENQGFEDEEFRRLTESEQCPEIIKHFVWLLATCHNVLPEPDPSQKYGISFQAPSPDEGALVEAAADMGYVFCGKGTNTLTVKVNGKETTVDVVANLEFTSERKRSTVVIKYPETNQYVLYMKGADDTILSRLKEKNTQLEITTRQHLQEFSDGGLRTLCLGYKILDPEWTESWARKLNEANCLVNGRDEAVAKVAEEIENDINLIGATAIEDKLQMGVPDTIESLLRAKIHVWIITGDKRETAINIGYACSLLSPEMSIKTFDEETLARDIESAESENGELALVITGSAIPSLLSDTFVDRFIQLSKRCKSVICCRVSPLQKALIVKTMRDKTAAMAVAIGDGANDVGMILEADIGIGVSGKEGRQAVLASDYSIAQFRYLKRLLLVHGRLDFYRNVECIFYSFYKNMCYTFNQMIYAAFSHFSGTTMYDSVLYTIFNVFFTSVPIVVYSGYDRDVSLEAMMEKPELYDMDGKRAWFQSYPRFILNLFRGLVHAFIAFFISYGFCYPFESPDGMGVTQQEFAATVYFCVVAIVNVHMASLCSYWTWMHWFFVIGSVMIFPLIFLIIDGMGMSMTIKRVSVRWLKMPQLWFAVIASTIVAGIFVLIKTVIERSQNTLKNRVLLHEKIARKNRRKVSTIPHESAKQLI